MREWIDHILFSVEDWKFTLGQLGLLVILIVVSLLGYRFFTRSTYFSRSLENSNIDNDQIKNLRRKLYYFILILIVLLTTLVLDIDYFFPENEYFLSFSLFLEILLIIQGARIMDWMLSNLFIHRYYSRRDEPEHKRYKKKKTTEGSATRIVQLIVYMLAILLLFNKIGWEGTIYSTEITNAEGEVIKTISLTWSNVIISILILMVARLLVWLVTQLFLYSVYRRRGIDKGSQFAINQLIAYFVYIIAVFVALENVGINMTLIWTGAAALLVGVGLGLQQTFNDFVSGIVLLFERSTSVGDILEFDGKIGKVQKIGMRASILETRYNISVVVPNSKLVNENVINWSHYYNKVRFEVSVGVAYGSDTELVKNILIDVAENHNDVLEYPAPFVRFTNFGNSSLDFALSFFSRNYMFIDNVKSDIRFEIDRQFREKGITIPFPQRDVWIRSNK